MPRGGQREGSGRKSTWLSGAKFENTVLVRVPKNIRDKVLEIAHRLDVGEIIDLDTKSIREENEHLKREMGLLKQQLTKSSEEIRQLQTEKNPHSGQLELFTISPTPELLSKEVLVKIRDHCLQRLPTGKQSAQYAQVRKIFNEFIKIVLSGKY